jgi:hypothetical protein
MKPTTSKNKKTTASRDMGCCPVCRVPWTNHIGIIGTCETVQKLRAMLRKYRRGISEVLRENAHLADGEDCTLIKLKRLMANTRGDT